MPAPPNAHRWLLPVLVVVVSLMVGGGLLARELYRLPDQQPDAILALPTSTARPPDQQPGPGTVELTPDAAAHPQHDAISQLLQTYFDSINNRDYDQWKTTVTRARIQAKSRAEWLKDYQSVKDGSILVYRIDTITAQDLRVLVGFTSVQDAASAPAELPGAACVQWKLSLPVTIEQGHWRVDSVAGYTTPEVARC
ncbi:hypothetical protein GCM10017566_73240 [Amycolatopsis bartoniae]|uniref:Uncharacterized protein n=1 Tax=Amycolatopsis bartoniae TaxID=941986 RepID=A0A8H9J3S9_9PSEU|nr:hypothetical protein GCM10017566_73240 [Amycolatopsis bartoniae]